MLRGKVATFILSIVFISIACTLGAQPADPPNHFLSIQYTLKPGMMSEFRQFVINEWNPLAKKGGLTERHFWIQRIGAGNVVYMGNPMELERMDGPNYVQRALENDEAKQMAFGKKLYSYIESTELSILEIQDELTYVPENPSPRLTAGELFLYEVEAGQDAVAQEIWKQNMEAAKKAGLGRWMARRIYGGTVEEVVSLTMYPSFADLAKGRPVSRAFGQEAETKNNEKIAPVLNNLRRYLLVYDTEMSFTPDTTPTTSSSK
jgi:hypothetical protein